MIEISKSDAMVLFGWLRVYRHEVDITQEDIELVRKLAPLLPDEFTGTLQDIERQFNEQ